MAGTWWSRVEDQCTNERFLRLWLLFICKSNRWISVIVLSCLAGRAFVWFTWQKESNIGYCTQSFQPNIFMALIVYLGHVSFQYLIKGTEICFRSQDMLKAKLGFVIVFYSSELIRNKIWYCKGAIQSELCDTCLECSIWILQESQITGAVQICRNILMLAFVQMFMNLFHVYLVRL